MVQDEWVLVFEDTHLNTQFHRDVGFPLADPFGVRFKDREDLFVRRDDFPQNDLAMKGFDNFDHIRDMVLICRAPPTPAQDHFTVEKHRGEVVQGA